MALTWETIYLIGLIAGGVLTLLYIFLSDMIEGMFEALPDGWLNPAVILAFVTFLSANGYLFEKLKPFNSLLILIGSIIVSTILTTLFNVFILIPLASAEESLAYSDEDLKGRIGRVILSIPEDGYGEVIVSGNSGNIAKPAVGFDNQSITDGREIIVIDVKNGVLYVSERDALED